MSNVVDFKRLKKIMDRIDEYKPMIESQEVWNVCFVYMSKDGVIVEVLGYEPTVEMAGMLDIAKDIVKEMVV